MRIGHQIYNYLFDIADNGICILDRPVEFEVIGHESCYILGAFIDFKDDQVYLNLQVDGIHVQKNIPDFLRFTIDDCMNRDYKPLYQLRDKLKLLQKQWYKQWKLRNIIKNKLLEKPSK